MVNFLTSWQQALQYMQVLMPDLLTPFVPSKAPASVETSHRISRKGNRKRCQWQRRKQISRELLSARKWHAVSSIERKRKGRKITFTENKAFLRN